MAVGGSVQGVVVKVDTSGAIVAQEQLRTKTTQVFVELEKQAKAVATLEQSIQHLGQTTQRGFSLTGGGIFAPEQLAQSVAGAQQLGDAVQNAGRQASGATSFFRNLTGAVGGTGAARGFGLATSAVRALAGSINPLGIAVGIASGALLQMVINAGSAQTALEKLEQQSKEAFEAFTLAGQARGRAQSAIGDLTLGRGGQNTDAQRAEELQKNVEKLRQGIENLGKESERMGDKLSAAFQKPVLLGAQQIVDLLTQLDRTDLLKDLETSKGFKGAVGPGGEFTPEFKAISRLSDVGIKTSFGTDAVMSGVDANKLLTAELDKQKKTLHDLNVEIEQRNANELKSIGIVQQRDFEESALGQNERAALSAIRANRDKIGRPFTLGEIDVNDRTIASARELDKEAEAAKEAAKALQDCTQAEEQRQKAVQDAQKDYEKSIATLQNEIDTMNDSEQERKKQAILIDLEGKARAANIPLTEELVAQLQDLAEQSVAAKEAGESLSKIEQQMAHDTQRLAELEKKRVDTIRELNDETQVFLATTHAQQQEQKILADLNRSLTELGIRRDSREGKELEDAVRRNALAREYAETLGKVADKSQQIGEDIGGAFFAAAQQTGAFGKNLQVALRELAEMEGKRAIIALVGSLFRAAGAAAFSSIFGQPTTPPTFGPQTTGVVGLNEYQALGGVHYRAASGLMVDRWGVVNYGNRSVGVGEGGGSKPEAIMPLQRNQYGELGVAMSGAWGGNYVANFPNVRTAEEASRTRPTQIQVFKQLERMRGRYGASMRSR